MRGAKMNFARRFKYERSQLLARDALYSDESFGTRPGDASSMPSCRAAERRAGCLSGGCYEAATTTD